MIVSLSLNLSKIEKSWLIDGKKGKYLPLTLFVSDEPNEYGQTVSAILEQTQEQRQAKEAKIYLGNGKTISGGNTNNNSKKEESVIDGLNF